MSGDAQFGVVLPQTEIGAGPDDIRAFADGVAALGLKFITMYDHVLGADRAAYPDWSGPYDHTHLFHEPFVTLGFLAAISQLDLATGVLVLPQRQAALVAKQAAEVDVLSGGRLRIGAGIGWNYVEYEALGEDFSSRGQRMEEQIVVMRKLWTEAVVDFTGRWHRIASAGLNPRPEQPIPVWLAASADTRALRRVGRVADGWLPMVPPGTEFDLALGVIREAAAEAGRDASSLGIEGRINVGDGDLDRIARSAEAWRGVGTSRIVLNTLNTGLGSIDAHLDALARAVDHLAKG